jgi:glycosyltransferase involved in cell wall biosynthesis
MRLLILDQFSEPGGAQQCLLGLLPAIRARGWQACVALPGDGSMVGRIREAGFETAALECGPYTNGPKSAGDLGRFLSSTPRLARQIRDLAASVSADLIYVNGPRLLPAVAAASRPVVFHAHRIIPAAATRALCGWSLRHLAARVIGVCRFAADPWERFVGAGRVKVIYNGVAGPTALRLRPPNTPPRIGCIGRIAPEKGQLEFLQAARLIQRQLPDAKFVIHGAAIISEPGYEHQVRAAAQGLPVEFAGWTEDIQTALADLDLLLAPSDPYEATTRVILEAFAAGTPVIAFASGGIPEVIEHGRTGFLAHGVEEMAQYATALLGAGEKRAAIVQAAHQSWQARFTLDAWRNAVLDYIGQGSAVANAQHCA